MIPRALSGPLATRLDPCLRPLALLAALPCGDGRAGKGEACIYQWVSFQHDMAL